MLTPEAQAALIMGINSYYFDSVEPNFNDIVLKASWALIKPQLETSEKKAGRPRKEAVEPIHIEVGKVEDKKEEPIILGEKIDDFDLMLSNPSVQEEKPADSGFNFFGSSYTPTETKPKKTKKEKEPKHKYGTYNNIELTDAEMERLNNEYGKDKTNKAIEFLSGYKQEKGYKTKDDNLTLRRWVFDAVDKQNNTSSWGSNNIQKKQDYSYEDEELKQIRERNRREMEEWERQEAEKEKNKNGEIF